MGRFIDTLNRYFFYPSCLILCCILLISCGSEEIAPTAQQPILEQTKSHKPMPEQNRLSSGPPMATQELIKEKDIARLRVNSGETVDPEEIVLSPEEAEGRGLTRREREQLAKPDTPQELNREVASITVDPVTGQGMTWEEFERFLKQQDERLEFENEVASITLDDGGKGMTWKEFTAYLKSQSDSQSGMELGLIETLEGPPLTYWELERSNETNNLEEKEVQR